jgi:hypothetical protein
MTVHLSIQLSIRDETLHHAPEKGAPKKGIKPLLIEGKEVG